MGVLLHERVRIFGRFLQSRQIFDRANISQDNADVAQPSPPLEPKNGGVAKFLPKPSIIPGQHFGQVGSRDRGEAQFA